VQPHVLDSPQMASPIPSSVDSGYHDMDSVSSPQSEDSSSTLAIDDYDALPAINHRKDIDLDDIQLVNVATKTLNKILKKSGVSKDRAKEIKQDRRTLKNRGYAANCRVKREKEEHSLEIENENLRRKIARQREDIRKEVAAIEVMENTIKSLEEEVYREEQELAKLEEMDEGFESLEEENIAQRKFLDLKLKNLSTNGLILEPVASPPKNEKDESFYIVGPVTPHYNKKYE